MPFRPCVSCNGTGICGRRDLHFVMLPNAEAPVPSHDDYGNSHRNHTCCQCKGAKFYDCDHHQDAGLTTSWNNDVSTPIVTCRYCNTKWTTIPANTRIHSGSWSVLLDVIKEHILAFDSGDMYSASKLEQRAMDIMNQYLDWRPAYEKQTIAEKIIETHLPRMSDSHYGLIGCDCGWLVPNELIVLRSREQAFSNHLLKTIRTSSEWQSGIDFSELATKQGKEHKPIIKGPSLSFGASNQKHKHYIERCSCGYVCTSSDTDTEFVEHVVYMAGPDPMKPQP